MVTTHRAPRRRYMSALAGLALALVPVTILSGNRMDGRAARQDAASAGGAPVEGVTRGASSQRTPSGVAPSGLGWHSAGLERHRHQVVSFKGRPNGWQARNPGQQWLTRFDAHGFAVQPDSGGWTWGLTLQRYGAGTTQRAVASSARVRVEGDRVTYTWDNTVDEWLVNEQRGLEHGFTVRKRPAGDGPLTLWIGVRGELRPDVQPDGQGVVFRDVDGASALSYAGLTVLDSDGHMVAAHFEPAGARLALVVNDSGAHYPLVIDPLAQQTAYLKASNTNAFDSFGSSVAVSGETVIVGAPGEDSSATGVDGDQTDNTAAGSGAAYVFVRNGGVWSQQAYLKASNTGPGDLFGSSVAISGDVIIVGAPGESSAATGVNGDQTSNSAPGSGAAYVFARNGNVWSQQAYLKASNTGGPYVLFNGGDGFGGSVGVSGDIAVVGAANEDSGATGVNGDQTSNSAFNSGAAYVFVRTGTDWTQQAYLKASNTGGCGCSGGGQPGDLFGTSVAVSGETIVVGAPNEDSSATGVNGTEADNTAAEAGAAYVFVRNGSTWTQQTYLKASNTEAGDGFGRRVGVSGDTIVVGALGEDSAATGVNGTETDNSAAGAGAAYVFMRDGANWGQQAYVKGSNTQASDGFGFGVAISGDLIVVGAAGKDLGAGAAYVSFEPNPRGGNTPT